MAFAPQLYDSTTVFLWIDGSVSKIATDLFPNTAVKRTTSGLSCVGPDFSTAI